MCDLISEKEYDKNDINFIYENKSSFNMSTLKCNEKERLVSEHMEYYKIKINNNFVGFVLLINEEGFDENPSKEIEIGIYKKYRKRGYAQKVIKKIIDIQSQNVNISSLIAIIKAENPYKNDMIKCLSSIGFVSLDELHWVLYI